MLPDAFFADRLGRLYLELFSSEDQWWECCANVQLEVQAHCILMILLIVDVSLTLLRLLYVFLCFSLCVAVSICLCLPMSLSESLFILPIFALFTCWDSLISVTYVYNMTEMVNSTPIPMSVNHGTGCMCTLLSQLWKRVQCFEYMHAHIGYADVYLHAHLIGWLVIYFVNNNNNSNWKVLPDGGKQSMTNLITVTTYMNVIYFKIKLCLPVCIFTFPLFNFLTSFLSFVSGITSLWILWL